MAADNTAITVSRRAVSRPDPVTVRSQVWNPAEWRTSPQHSVQCFSFYDRLLVLSSRRNANYSHKCIRPGALPD